jgi:hypothetical protein
MIELLAPLALGLLQMVFKVSHPINIVFSGHDECGILLDKRYFPNIYIYINIYMNTPSTLQTRFLRVPLLNFIGWPF